MPVGTPSLFKVSSIPKSYTATRSGFCGTAASPRVVLTVTLGPSILADAITPEAEPAGWAESFCEHAPKAKAQHTARAVKRNILIVSPSRMRPSETTGKKG